MASTQTHPPMPPRANWMTLSPEDGVRQKKPMSTVIELSKQCIPAKRSIGLATVTTVQEIQTPPEDMSPIDEAIDMKPASFNANTRRSSGTSTPLKSGTSTPYTMPLSPLPASTRLQKMIHETDDLIVCPGVYDGVSARVAHEVGFDALYMTGAGTSCSRLGMADLGLATLADMRAQADMICSLVPQGAPVIADIDGGYGGPMMIDRAVKEYIRSGVAGFHIEDQLIQKRCGHLKGKAVVPREEYYSRIRAAQSARKQYGSDIVLIARTDALQQQGYEECIERLKGARELGADVGLLEGFSSKEMAAKCAKELAPWPLLMNSVENGASPLITVDEAREMGFRIMIFSFASIAPAYLAIKNTFENLKKTGTLGTPKDITPRKLFEVCGLEDLVEVDMGAGGQAFAQGV